MIVRQHRLQRYTAGKEKPSLEPGSSREKWEQDEEIIQTASVLKLLGRAGWETETDTDVW